VSDQFKQYVEDVYLPTFAPQAKRSNCDVCDERPWTHQGVVTGIETFYCCQCGNHEPCEE